MRFDPDIRQDVLIKSTNVTLPCIRILSPATTYKNQGVNNHFDGSISPRINLILRELDLIRLN